MGRDGCSLMSQFNHWQPFGLHFRHRHQVNKQNNRIHAPISIKRTRATKFWTYRNFTWYLAVTEVNTALAYGQFHKGGKFIPNFQFHRKFAHDIMENTIVVKIMDSVRSRRLTCTPTIVPCKLQKAKNHEGRYDKKKSQAGI